MNTIQHDNETISLKKIIIYYIRHWKLFVLAAIISLIPALLYLIFTPRTYEIAAKIQLIEDKSNSSNGFNVGDASGLMKSFGLGGIGGGSINLDDEMAKLTSNSILKDMVLKLGLNISYYKPYAFKYKMYEDIPLILYADSTTECNLDCTVTFDVDIKKDGKIKVKTEALKEKKVFEFASLPAEIKLKEGDFILAYRDEAIKPLSLTLDISPAGWVAENIYQDFTFDEYSKNANVIEISYVDYERRRGLNMLNTLVDIYNHQEDSIKRAEGMKSLAFLEERIQHVMTDLSETEVSIERYKLKNRMTDIEADVQFYVEQLKELQSKIIELEAQDRIVEMLNVYIKEPQNMYNLIPSLLSTGEGDKAGPITTYNEALLERAKLLQTTKGNNPLIEQINKQVDQLRGSVFLAIENSQKAIQFTLNDLKAKEKLIMDKMGTVPSLEREYIDYKRQQEIYQAVYLILLQKREDIALSIGESKDRARFVEKAYVKQSPIGPRKLYAAVGMLLFTLIIPVAFLFGREQFSALRKEYKETK